MDAYTALNSEYIIDGNRMDSTPAALLEECGSRLKAGGRCTDTPVCGSISDESLDRTVTCPAYKREQIARYAAEVEKLCSRPRPFETAFPKQHSRQRIAKALIDAIWTKGDFSLDSLELALRWEWNPERMGAMAAFYASAAAASDYIYDLDCSASRYDFCDRAGSTEYPDSAEGGECRFECKVEGCGSERICPEKIKGDDSDWIIYIPFDTCAFRLGGSLLSRIEGDNGDLAPENGDPDWFIDCYEVVRELVCDGIVLSGTTVCDGGLQAALGRICDNARLNISGISSSYREDDTVRILFSEVPGVLIRIRDIDFDYLDSQMLLQDIAYYPLGHPCAEGGISVTDHSPNGIGRILDSLMSQASEGED